MYKIIFFFSSHLTANSSQSFLTSKMLTHHTHKTNVQGAKLVQRHHADMRILTSVYNQVSQLTP